MDKHIIIDILNNHTDLKNKIFSRGFLLTNGNVDEQEYPFYGNWKCLLLGGAKLLSHPDILVSHYVGNNCTLAIVGHAYNSFTMEKDETLILKELNDCYGENTFFELLNQLTGVFTLFWMDGEKVFFAGDATCMQTTFYTIENESYYISSHTNLIGDLLSLEWDEYVTRLVKYKFFKLLGNSLPGDLTQFSGVKRAVPNFYYEISGDSVLAKRFYTPKKLLLSNQEIVENVAKLLNSNMQLIAEKWNKPAISLTGGCDSKTTLSCANGVYDKFLYFSYISSVQI